MLYSVNIQQFNLSETVQDHLAVHLRTFLVCLFVVVVCFLIKKSTSNVVLFF